MRIFIIVIFVKLADYENFLTTKFIIPSGNTEIHIFCQNICVWNARNDFLRIFYEKFLPHFTKCIVHLVPYPSYMYVDPFKCCRIVSLEVKKKTKNTFSHKNNMTPSFAKEKMQITIDA